MSCHCGTARLRNSDDSLSPFSGPISKLSKDRFCYMEIVTSPSEGVIDIYIRDFESGKSFSLPA